MTLDLALTEAQQRRSSLGGQLDRAQQRLARTRPLASASGYSAGAPRVEPHAEVHAYVKQKAEATAAGIWLQIRRPAMADFSAEIELQSSTLRALYAQFALIERTSKRISGIDPRHLDHYREFKYREAPIDLLELPRLDQHLQRAMNRVASEAQNPGHRRRSQGGITAHFEFAADITCRHLTVPAG